MSLHAKSKNIVNYLTRMHSSTVFPSQRGCFLPGGASFSWGASFGGGVLPFRGVLPSWGGGVVVVSYHALRQTPPL